MYRQKARPADAVGRGIYASIRNADQGIHVLFILKLFAYTTIVVYIYPTIVVDRYI